MRQRIFEQPTAEEIKARENMYAEAESLGIDLMCFDTAESTEEKGDVRKAVVLLGRRKPIPNDLRNRLTVRFDKKQRIK